MAKQADEIGESTITLAADDDSKSERRFYARLGGVLLLAVLACLVWLIVAPLWHPLAWAVLLGSLLAPLNLRVTARLGGRTQLGSAVTMVAAVLLFILPVVGVPMSGGALNGVGQLHKHLDSPVEVVDGFRIR